MTEPQTASKSNVRQETVRRRLQEGIAGLDPLWAAPLTMYVEQRLASGEPLTDFVLAHVRSWSDAYARLRPTAPQDVPPAAWSNVVEQWSQKPNFHFPDRTVGRASVHAWATCCRRLLRIAHAPNPIPQDTLDALRILPGPSVMSRLVAEEQGPPIPRGRPALSGDSLARVEDNDRRHALAVAAALPPAWQMPLQRHLEDLQMRAKTANSMRACARAWRKAYRFFGEGSDPAKLVAQDWQRMALAWLHQAHPRDPSRALDRSTVAAYAAYVRSVLRFCYLNEDLPRPIRRALGASTGPLRLKGKVMDQAQFHALLEAASSEVEARHPHQVAEKLALLWTVWDAGGRISEVLGLNVGGIAVSAAGGVLRMHKMPRQKTGPRDIAVTEAAGVLMAWLEVHPASGNPDAPLFCNLYTPTGTDRMSYKTACGLFKRWRERGGLPIVNGKPFHWHDLRHTRATRVAKQKWDPAMKARHFGWSPGSTMAQLYSHIATEDILQQLQRDVGIDDKGFRIFMGAGDEAAALRHLLNRLLGNGGPVDATTRPPGRVADR